MTDITDYAKQILFGCTLADKLTPIPLDCELTAKGRFEAPILPGRDQQIAISTKKAKFPKGQALKEATSRGKALHFFANHELLAIEIMALGLLTFPCNSKHEQYFAKWLISSLTEEQEHLQLYIRRMQQLGIDFGELPLNGFFWDQFIKIKTIDEYCCAMGLTFEAANLDFARYYGAIFSEYDDPKTGALMQKIYLDEIGHVAIARNWFHLTRPKEELWKLYLENLPWPITPARSKGPLFCEEGRLRAGLSKSFCEQVQNYDDGYRVTQRKEWKNDNASLSR